MLREIGPDTPVTRAYARRDPELLALAVELTASGRLDQLAGGAAPAEAFDVLTGSAPHG